MSAYLTFFVGALAIVLLFVGLLVDSGAYNGAIGCGILFGVMLGIHTSIE